METGMEGIFLPPSWKELERQVAYCAFCPKMCRFSCPAAMVRPSEALHPTGKADLLIRILRGQAPLNREAAEILYRCTGCMLSRTYCVHEIAVYPPLENGRNVALKAGVAPDAVCAVLRSLDELGNPFGRGLTAPYHEVVPRDRREPRAQVLIFPGCATIAHAPEVLEDLIRVLRALRVDVAGFPEEPLCCGGMQAELGDAEGFTRKAAALYPVLSGARRILTLCPHCTYSLKSRYGALDPGLGNRVVHISQFLAEILSGYDTLIQPLEARVLYHDPCFLGRYLGTYDAPREILMRILPPGGLVEFSHHRDQAECCGGGCGFPVAFPEDALSIARLRLTAAPDGIETIATACPWCLDLLRRADSAERARDVLSLLAEALSSGKGKN